MKAFRISNTRRGTKANSIRLNVQSCGLFGWRLDRERQIIDEQGYVTADQLKQMRDDAAHALKLIDGAIADAMAVTGKSVIEV